MDNNKKKTKDQTVLGQVKRISLKDIVPSKDNPRKTFNPEELNELAESIKENGLLQPITVRPIKSSFATFEIVCGERRYRATQLTGAEVIDCIVKELDDKAAFAAMVLENLQRKDVDHMEEAAAIDKLVNSFATDVARVAKMIGKSETFVRSRLRLNGTIPEFVDLMNNGPLVLTHLLEICKLPAEQQKTLYECCFTPECIERWKYKFPNIPQLKEMIESNILMQLSKATFSLVDETFEGHLACVNCPLNTKQNPSSEGAVLEPRCMNRNCFMDKTLQRIFREAKALPIGVEVVFHGDPTENDTIIRKAASQGIKVYPMGVRKYVINPPEPRKEDFTEQEFYQKRVNTWKHQKAIFDIGVKEFNIVPVYEVCYSGHASGEFKYVYNIKDVEGNGDIEKQKRQELIMKYKDELININDKKDCDRVEAIRLEMQKSEFGSLNMTMSVAENDILIALLFKHLPYEFKQKLGLEWNMEKDSWKNNKEVMDKNRNSIKREFIKLALSDKSVNYSRDLQGMLEGIMKDRYGSTLSAVNKLIDKKYVKLKDSIKNKIEDLNVSPPKEEEIKPEENPKVESDANLTDKAEVKTEAKVEKPTKEKNAKT